MSHLPHLTLRLFCELLGLFKLRPVCANRILSPYSWNTYSKSSITSNRVKKHQTNYLLAFHDLTINIKNNIFNGFMLKPTNRSLSWTTKDFSIMYANIPVWFCYLPLTVYIWTFYIPYTRWVLSWPCSQCSSHNRVTQIFFCWNFHFLFTFVGKTCNYCEHCTIYKPDQQQWG